MTRVLKDAGLVLFAAMLASGCATASNYLDPQGPRSADNVAGAPPAERGEIRVVSFNIAHSKRITEAITILQEHAPLRHADILTLQEMDAPGTEAIARALGMNYVFFPASRLPQDEHGQDMGESVLSPWPIEESWKVLMPHLTHVLHRSCAAAAARIRIGERTIVAYSVHFGSPWGMGATKRREQAQTVLADARDRPEPIVIAGDFNSKGVSHVFADAGFLWLTRDIGGTAGPLAFDHVVARGFVAVGDPAAGVVRKASQASDHRPVWAVLAFAP